MATKSTRYVSEGRQEEYDEADHANYSEEQPASEADASEPRCATCGELLAWHEVTCSSIAEQQPSGKPALVVMRVSSPDFVYNLGHLVQPAPEAPAYPVIWRGQLKERHPATGLVQRVNVYRLGDGYWDCYREEDLQVA